MRFFLHNPHLLYWYKSAKPGIFKNSKDGKYFYLIDYLLETNHVLYIYIDNFRSSQQILSPLANLLKFVNLYIWLIFNNINIFKVRIFTDCKKLNRDDILFTFLYGNFTNDSGCIPVHRLAANKQFSRCKALKVVHCTHYMYYSSYGSTNLALFQPDVLVAENNLIKNSGYFQRHFNWYNNLFYVLPFAPNKKFKILNSFYNRLNKCLAIGTLTLPANDPEFTSYYGTDQIHPMRKQLYDLRSQLTSLIDCYISPIIEKCIYSNNLLFFQPSYHKLDFPALFNGYRMFLVPEEINSLPGISFVEGMICGSAFIGLQDPMYDQLGLVHGFNYISYDGTLEDLKRVISYYQSSPSELQVIALNGQEFASKNFASNVVASKFLNFLQEIANSRLKDNFLFDSKSSF